MLDHLVRIYSIQTIERPAILTNQLTKVHHIRLTNQTFISRLRRSGPHTPTIFEAYSEWINTTSILIQEYAANCALAFDAIRDSFGLDDAYDLEAIQEYIQYPYEHADRQRRYLRQLSVEQQELKKLEKVVVDECDAIESKLYECVLLIKDNLMVNHLPGVSCEVRT